MQQANSMQQPNSIQQSNAFNSLDSGGGGDLSSSQLTPGGATKSTSIVNTEKGNFDSMASNTEGIKSGSDTENEKPTYPDEEQLLSDGDELDDEKPFYASILFIIIVVVICLVIIGIIIGVVLLFIFVINKSDSTDKVKDSSHTTNMTTASGTTGRTGATGTPAHGGSTSTTDEPMGHGDPANVSMREGSANVTVFGYVVNLQDQIKNPKQKRDLDPVGEEHRVRKRMTRVIDSSREQPPIRYKPPQEPEVPQSKQGPGRA